MSSIHEVKAKHTDRLLTLPGVVSVGVGKDTNGNPAIIVGLDQAQPETEAQIPETLESFPVVIQIVGKITAQ